MFKMVESGKASIAQRGLVYGVGVNDAWYQVTIRVSGVKYRCPYYHSWTRMLERCYSEKRAVTNPSYNDCTVADEWLIFSNFRSWMVRQNWKGMELDKDIKVPRSRIYSKDTCMFVTKTENAAYKGCRAKVIKENKARAPQAGVETFVNGVGYISAGAAAKFIHEDSGRSNVKDISRRIRKFLADSENEMCSIYGKYEVS
jgi:hypothetical protein